MKTTHYERYLQAVAKGIPLTTRQAAKYLGVSLRTLEGARKDGIGPVWRYRYVAKGSGHVVYERACLDAFLPGGIAEYDTADEAARTLGRSKRTLEEWRAKGGGPSWVRLFARLVLYNKAEVVHYKLSMIAGTPQQTEADKLGLPRVDGDDV